MRRRKGRRIAAWLLSAALTVCCVELPAASVHAENLTGRGTTSSAAVEGLTAKEDLNRTLIKGRTLKLAADDLVDGAAADSTLTITVPEGSANELLDLTVNEEGVLEISCKEGISAGEELAEETVAVTVADDSGNSADVTFSVKIEENLKIELDLRKREFNPKANPTSAETIYKAAGNEAGKLRQVEDSIEVSMTFRFDASKSYNAGGSDMFYLLEIGDSRNNYKEQPNAAPASTPSTISFVFRNGGNRQLYCNTGSYYVSTGWDVGQAIPSGSDKLHTLTLSISPTAINVLFDDVALKTANGDTKNTKKYIASFFGADQTYEDWRNNIDTFTIGDCYEWSAGRHNNYGRFGGDIKSVVISDGTYSNESMMDHHKSYGTELAKEELQTAVDDFESDSNLSNEMKAIFRESDLYKKADGILKGTAQTYAGDIYNTADALKEALSDPENIGLNEIGGSISNMFNSDWDNSWIFGGGRETQGSFSEIGGMRNFIGHFEEYVRWNKSGSEAGRQRYTINLGKAGSDAATFAAKLDDYIAKLRPKAVSYLVGPEDYTKGDAGIDAFKASLGSIIEKSLAINNGNGYVVIALPHVVLGDNNALAKKYASAAKDAMRAYLLSHKEHKDRIAMVDHMALTSEMTDFVTECLTKDGFLNGKGHYELAKQFSLKTYGSTQGFPTIRDWTAEEQPENYENIRPSVTASEGGNLNVVVPADVAADKTNWNYTVEIGDIEICGSAQEGAGRAFTIDGLPDGKDYVLTLKSADNEICLAKAYGTLTKGNTGGAATLTALQKKIRDKVDDTGRPLTWLFMGDSITHAAAHTLGYDGIAQIFEKYLKDDLGRTDDIVINTAVSGATAQSTINRIEERLKRYTPDIVSIMIGTNDVSTKGMTSGTYTSQLEQIVKAIRERNKDALIIFRTPTPANPSNHAERIRNLEAWTIDAMQRTAEKDGNILCINQYTEWNKEMKTFPYLFNANYYYNDPLHPNAAGQLRMAKQFIQECGLNTDTRIANLSYGFNYQESANETQPEFTEGRSRVALETKGVEDLQTASNKTFGSLDVTLTDSEDGRTYTKKSYAADGRIIIPYLRNNGESGRQYTASITGTSASSGEKVTFAGKNVTVSASYPVIPYYVFLDSGYVRNIVEDSVAAKFYTGPAAPETGHQPHHYKLVADDDGKTYDNNMFVVEGDKLKIKTALLKSKSYQVCVQVVHDDDSGCSQKSVYTLRTTPTLEEIRRDAKEAVRALDLDLAGVLFDEDEYVDLGEENSVWYNDGKYLDVLNKLRTETTGGTIFYRFRTETPSGLIFGSGSHKTNVNPDNTIMAFGLDRGEPRGIFRAPSNGLRGNFNAQAGMLNDGRWHTVAISFDTTKEDFQNQILMSIDGGKNIFYPAWWSEQYKSWFNQNSDKEITHFAIGGGACVNSVWSTVRLEKFIGDVAFVTVNDKVYTEEELKLLTRTDWIIGEQNLKVNGTKVTLPEGAHYTADQVVWDEDNNGAEFTLTAEDGFLFDDGVSAAITNGTALGVMENTQMELSADNKSVKVTFRTIPWRTESVLEAEEVTVKDGVSDGASISQDIIAKLGVMRRGSVTVRYKLDEKAMNAEGRIALFSVSDGSKNGYSAFYVTPSTGAVGYTIRDQEGNAGTIVNADEAVREDIKNENWHTVTYVFSATGTEGYLDGNRILANTDVGFLRNTSNISHAQIGSVYRGADEANAFAFGGEINSIQVTYDVLDAEEIAKLHEATAPKELDLPADAVKTEDMNLYYEGYEGSQYYRMPSILTTEMGGTVFAAVDKRQTTEADRGNIDTIIRKSTDNGRTWSDPQTIFNQPDGGIMYSFTTAPTMVEGKNGRIHIIANLFPESQGRLATGLIEKGSGFKEVNGKLYPILRNYKDTALNAEDDWTKEYTIRENGVVYEETESGGTATEYRVPKYLAAEGGGDLFKGDSNTPCGNIYVYTGENAGELKMPRVMSVVSCYSDDNGATWEGYQNITGMIKEDWMKFMRVGPGAGIRLKNQKDPALNGRILIPVCYTNGDGIYSYAASLIYSDDNGVTWHRTESPVTQVSQMDEQTGTFREASLRESQIVEMNDGTLKMFSLNYSGYLKMSSGTFEADGLKWTSVKETTIRDLESPISAIHALVDVDGKEAVLLSAPLGPDSNNGYIHIGLYQEDGTFEWKYLRKVKADGFGNSCMSILDNKNIGILFKGTGDNIVFTSMNESWLTAPRHEEFKTPVIEDIKMGLDGESLVFTVTLDSALMKKGEPYLKLKLDERDAQAAYVSGNGTKVYTFRYDMDESEFIEIEAVNVAAGASGFLENPVRQLPQDVSFKFSFNRDLVVQAVQEALDRYKAIYESDGSDYDAELFSEFKKAYEAARDAIDAEGVSAKELQHLLKELNGAASVLGGKEDTIEKLEQALEDYRQIYESDGMAYDPDLFQEFKDAYEAALEAKGNESETAGSLLQKLKELNDAREALESREAIIQKMEEAIENFKSLYESDGSAYDAELFEEFKKAYEAVREAIQGDASASELSALLRALKDAKNALGSQDVTGALKALEDTLLAYKDTYDKKKAEYTETTWKAFEKAYEDAKRAVEAGTATKAELEQLKKALDEAFGALRKSSAAVPEMRQLAAPAITSLKAVAEKKMAGVKVLVGKVEGADIYTVYRTVGGSVTEIGRTNAQGVVYDQNPVSKKTASYYAVAESSAGQYKKSAEGAVKTIRLEASVKKITAKRVGKKTQVRLSWKKVKKAQKYVVYRSTKKSSGYVRLKTLKKNAKSYVDKKVKKGKTYYYRIVIKTKSGYSGITTSKKIKIKK